MIHRFSFSIAYCSILYLTLHFLYLRKSQKNRDKFKQGKINLWEETSIDFVTPKSTVVSCLEDLVESYEASNPSRGHIDVTHHITEACIAVAESHKQGGAWVDLPLNGRDLYIWHV